MNCQFSEMCTQCKNLARHLLKITTAPNTNRIALFHDIILVHQLWHNETFEYLLKIEFRSEAV